MSIAYDANQAQTLVQNVVPSPFENDPTEEGYQPPKAKKLSNKELQEKVALLEMKLEVARPEHIEKMIESHREAQLTIRDLNYHLREKDHTIGDLERRIEQLEAGQGQGSSDQGEKLRIAEAHINDLTDTNGILSNENTRLREEKGELEELFQTELLARNQRIEHLELKIVSIEIDQDRHKRLSGSKHISGNQKIVLLAIEDEIRKKTYDPQDLTPIDLMTIERKTGLAHSTVCKEVGRLEEYGAFTRDDTYTERQKKGRKIIVDKISLALTDLAMQYPEDIQPGAGGERNHGGKRLRCRNCGSHNVRRLFHIQCLNCGEEFVNRPPIEAENDELIQDERVQPSRNHCDQAKQVSRLETQKQASSFQLVQDERVQSIIPTAQLVQDERVRGNLALQVETHNQIQPDELVQDERVRELHQLETHNTTTNKGIKLEELRVCGRCGDVPTFIRTPLGTPVCSCSRYSLDELKKRKGPQQTELL